MLAIVEVVIDECLLALVVCDSNGVVVMMKLYDGCDEF